MSNNIDTSRGHGDAAATSESAGPTTLELLLERHGALLDARALAQVLGFKSAKQVTNALCDRRLRLPSAKIGGRRQVRVQDVAAYIDAAVEEPVGDREAAAANEPLAAYLRWAD